jgi:type IV secretory pathway VirJ component
LAALPYEVAMGIGGAMPGIGPVWRAVLVILGLATAFIAFSAWLGWFGGPLFTDIRPKAGSARSPVAVVFFSGDLGFRAGMGPKVAARLAADGIPVTGVNSLTFFNRARRPAETAGLIRAAIARASSTVQGGRVALIGQSLGADMLQAGLSALPPEDRKRIALIALIVPGAEIQFEASPGGVFGFATPEASGVPTATQLDWAPLLCIQGMEEAASLCPLLHLPNLTRVALPGGHLLHNDADRVRSVLAAAIRSAAGAPPPARPLVAPVILYRKKDLSH